MAKQVPHAGNQRSPIKPQGAAPRPQGAPPKPAGKPKTQLSRPGPKTAPRPNSRSAVAPRFNQPRSTQAQLPLNDGEGVEMDEREQYENTQSRQAPTVRSKSQPATNPQMVPAVTGLTTGVTFDQLPEHMRDDVGKGTENINSEDMGIVQYKLMQPLSPELTERDDLRPGDFLHTGTGTNLGTSWYAVFIHYQKQQILWRPREDGGGILARAPDGIHWDPPNREFTVRLDKKDGGGVVTWTTARTVQESGLASWGTSNPEDSSSPPAATKMLTFLALPYEFLDLGPAVLTFQRASLKRGANLISKIKMVRGPMYGTIYKIFSFEDTNSVGQKFFSMRGESVGFVKDAQLYDQFKTLHESFARTGFDVRDVDQLQDEEILANEAEEQHQEQDEPAY